MATNIRASDVTLYELERNFKLQFIQESHVFFPEWQDNLLELDNTEKHMLDNIKASYFNLLKHHAMLENIVQMSVLGPILQLSGFFLHPFWIKSEASIRIVDTDEEITIEGKIDVLVLKDNFWILVIESKRMALSIETGLAQILSYMLASPHHPDKPTFGLITNGGSFIFIRLIVEEVPKYSLSQRFELLNPGNDLYMVLRILKQLNQLLID